MSYSIIDHLENQESYIDERTQVKLFKDYFSRYKSRNCYYVFVKTEAIKYLRNKYKLSYPDLSKIVYNRKYDGSIDHAIYHYVPKKEVAEQCANWLIWIDSGLYPTSVPCNYQEKILLNGKFRRINTARTKLKLIKLDEK